MKVISKEDLERPFATSQKVLSGKYALLLLNALRNGRPVRQGDLLRQYEDIGKMALKKQLRQLVEFGLLFRDSKKGIVPRVEYSLTTFGSKIIPAIDPLIEWEREYNEYFSAHFEELPDDDYEEYEDTEYDDED